MIIISIVAFALGILGACIDSKDKSNTVYRIFNMVLIIFVAFLSLYGGVQVFEVENDVKSFLYFYGAGIGIIAVFATTRYFFIHFIYFFKKG